ncbi:hypothetical protein CKO44_02010 [Rubrivivax gelatinosus]|uniref:PEP-CTERM system TPR-repeat lipoprotein n=1 Tax=Rubrivivax gelatinosus TaxID=28068 RepID=A0ABS1DY53_RUBGE|nr:XrtA/PEP-CTERM system TPR-repeat protein PrsT [Rubrivivax gelatinosus]MBK1612238.1 hypothetical protein [Rubrivivax gelatinosus]MBK1714304.1 hypothetical protein [Rubrivivax gelatinosus]
MNGRQQGDSVRLHFQRIAIAAAIAAALATVAGCGRKSEGEGIAAAKTHLAANDRGSAIIELKSALQQDPQSGEARYLLGKTLMESGDVASAEIELGKAHDLRFQDSLVLPLLAKVMLARGEAKQVGDLYARVELPDPVAAAELKAQVALAFAAQGQAERSQAAVDQALRLNPKNIAARLQEARLQARNEKPAQTLARLDGILADDPKNANAWLFKGNVLRWGLGDNEGAGGAYRQALKVEPRHLPSYAALVPLLLEKGDVAGMRALVTSMKQVLPQHPDTRYYGAQVALLDNDVKQARDSVQQLLKMAPTSVRLLQLAGAIELRDGRLLLAETYLNRAIQQEPELVTARRLLAQSQLRSGQPAKALAALKPLLDMPRPDAATLALAAEAHLQNGEAALAERYFTRAATLDPKNPKVSTALALTEISKGHVDEGFAKLEDIATHDPGTYADLALISARLRRQQPDAALAAVDRLQKKLEKEPLPYFLRGRILGQRADAAGARAAYAKAAELDPAYFPAVAGLAAIDVAENKPEDARKRFEALLARDPRDYRALLAVADLRQRAGAKPAEIAALLANAVKTNPGEATPRLLLIEHHLGQGDSKAALTVASEAVAALPDDMRLLDALGRSQLATGDLQQALASFGKAAAAQPELPGPQMRLADAYLNVKNGDKATETLQRLLKQTPDYLPAQQRLVQLAVLDKRYDDALAIARTVQKQRPKEAVGLLMEVEIRSGQKQWAAALDVTRVALQRSRTTLVAMRLHALTTLAGRQAEAERFAAAWEKEHPRDAEFQNHLAGVALEQRQFAAAEARYRKVAALRPNDALAQNNIAWLMVQQGKPGAVAVAERALQLSPGNASLLDTLALALAADKQMPRALQTQREAIAKAPEVPDYRLSLARLLILSGDKDGARGELQALAKMGTKFSGQAEVSRLLKTLS